MDEEELSTCTKIPWNTSRVSQINPDLYWHPISSKQAAARLTAKTYLLSKLFRHSTNTITKRPHINTGSLSEINDTVLLSVLIKTPRHGPVI